jgi:phosphoribosyl-dephospho-CoA transferase
LAITVPPEALLSNQLPLLLADAAGASPASWRPTIAALIAVDQEVRCFGSLAWAYLTGLPYLSAGSDIDLLWSVSTAEEADSLVRAIAAVEVDAPMGIDGELVTPAGLAIQWREWAANVPEVLAKARDGNRLVARNAVFA